MNQSVKQNPTNKQEIHHITQADLPLSCPLKGHESWNAHPRVYLDLDQSGAAQCPYCGAQYVLEKS